MACYFLLSTLLFLVLLPLSTSVHVSQIVAAPHQLNAQSIREAEIGVRNVDSSNMLIHDYR